MALKLDFDLIHSMPTVASRDARALEYADDRFSATGDIAALEGAGLDLV